MNLYTVETEDGITYDGVFAASEIEAAKEVAKYMDPEDEILEVIRAV